MDPLFEDAVVECPHAFFGRLREQEPVHRVEGTDAFVVTRLDLIKEVVGDPQRFSSRASEFLFRDEDGNVGLRPAIGSGGNDEQSLAVLATADPPEHTRHRALLSRIRLILPTLAASDLVDLTPARVRAWRAALLRAGAPGPSTVAKSYRLLSSMMAAAVVDNLIARNRSATWTRDGLEPPPSHGSVRRALTPSGRRVPARWCRPGQRAFVRATLQGDPWSR